MTETRIRQAAVTVLLAILVCAPLLPGRGEGPPAHVSSAATFSFSSPDAGGVLLTRVYANAARDDEFVEVANLGEETVDVSGWSLTDGEATAAFPTGSRLSGGARLVATRNATSYEEDVRAAADFTWERGDAPSLVGGVLRLANTGDEVLLRGASGDVVDAFAYGTSTYADRGWTGPPAPAPGRGQVSVRVRDGGGWQDTDGAADWSPIRSHRLGQSDVHPPPITLTSPPLVFLSPDDGAAPLVSFLSSASRTLDVGVYTLTSDALASTLAARAQAGVRVRVLLEGSPEGGVGDDERRIVAGLVDAGARVQWLQGADDVVKRYRYFHAKYAIVDGRAVLVSSENFGDAGFPAHGGGGNRGWSAVVEDVGLAGQLWEAFEEDFDPSRRDTGRALGGGAEPIGPPPAAPSWTPPATRCCVAARLVVGPDNALDADRILGLLGSARERIDIEAFYLDDTWPSGPNPLLEKAFESARRGVAVRILLDGTSWSSEPSDDGNAAVVARINDRARAEGLQIEARQFAPTGNVERVHNKGVVVDGRAVLVSSMNWAYVSATQDREIGLIVEDPDTVQRFAEAFVADWDGRSTSRPGGLDLSDPWTTVAVYGIVTGVCGLSLWKLRPGDKGTSGPPPMKRRGLSSPRLRGRRGEVRVLPAELVAQPRSRAGRGRRDRRGGKAARGRLEGPQRD